jgi:hypothetical protein
LHALGWIYRRLGGLPDVLSANLRWLAGYRHERVSDADVAARTPDHAPLPRNIFEPVGW